MSIFDMLNLPPKRRAGKARKTSDDNTRAQGKFLVALG